MQNDPPDGNYEYPHVLRWQRTSRLSNQNKRSTLSLPGQIKSVFLSVDKLTNQISINLYWIKIYDYKKIVHFTEMGRNYRDCCLSADVLFLCGKCLIFSHLPCETIKTILAITLPEEQRYNLPEKDVWITPFEVFIPKQVRVFQKATWKEASHMCTHVGASLPCFTSKVVLMELLDMMKLWTILPSIEAIYIGLNYSQTKNVCHNGCFACHQSTLFKTTIHNLSFLFLCWSVSTRT